MKYDELGNNEKSLNTDHFQGLMGFDIGANRIFDYTVKISD